MFDLLKVFFGVEPKRKKRRKRTRKKKTAARRKKALSVPSKDKSRKRNQGKKKIDLKRANSCRKRGRKAIKRRHAVKWKRKKVYRSANGKVRFSTGKKALLKYREKEIGVVTHYFGKISVGIIKLKGQIKVGDWIHIKGANSDFIQVISSMQINHKNVSSAKKGDEIGVKVIQPVHESDKVFVASGRS